MPYPVNAHSVGWNNGGRVVQTVPYTTDQTVQNRVYRGGFVYARRSGPVPGYQPPSNLGATPLIQGGPAPTTVNGVSFPQAGVPPTVEEQPKEGWKRFLKMPRLPKFKKQD